MVDALGAGARRASASGSASASPGCATPAATCRFCRRGDENLCPSPPFTGWDADGGYAEYAVVDERLRLPAARRVRRRRRRRRCCAPASSATGRCAGPPCRRAAGWASTASAARRTSRPRSPSPRAPRVHVLTRRPQAGAWPLELGALGRATPSTRRPSRSTPRSSSPPPASSSRRRWRALDRGGTLAVAGIHLSDIPPLRYAEHLFQERQLRSVTANTRDDGERLPGAGAAQIPIRVTTTPVPVRRGRRGAGRPRPRPGRGRGGPRRRRTARADRHSGERAPSTAGQLVSGRPASPRRRTA